MEIHDARSPSHRVIFPAAPKDHHHRCQEHDHRRRCAVHPASIAGRQHLDSALLAYALRTTISSLEKELARRVRARATPADAVARLTLQPETGASRKKFGHK